MARHPEDVDRLTAVLVEIDTASSVPPFAQLYEQVATMAASGVLPAGARLPAVRQLARDLDVAAGTVARAYRELETAGIVETRGRHGTYVRAGLGRAATPAGDDRREGELATAARVFAVRAHHLGITREAALATVAAAFDALLVNEHGVAQTAE